MAADRGAYICQSQSLNLFIQDANFAKLSSAHFYAWKKGLKTGMYYLRTKAATDAIKFTVEKQAEPAIEQTNLVNETELVYSEAAAKAAAASFDNSLDKNKAEMTCS